MKLSKYARSVKFEEERLILSVTKASKRWLAPRAVVHPALKRKENK